MRTEEQISLFDPDAGRLIDVDGRVCPKTGMSYIGKARKQLDGTWRCLANVDGALCLVEVAIHEL